MIRRAIVVVQGDEPGVLDQAAQMLAPAAQAVGAEVLLARPGEPGASPIDASPAEHLNGVLAEIGDGTALILAAHASLDAGAMELLLEAAEQDEVVAVPVLAGCEGRVRSAGRVELAHRGRGWLTDLLAREPLAAIAPPRQTVLGHARGDVLAVSCARALAVGGFGDRLRSGRERDASPDTDDFVERHRASGGTLVLVGDAVAVLRDPGPKPLWTEFKDPHRLGAPPERTAANAAVVRATGVIAQALRSEPLEDRGARERAQLVFSAAGAVGADAEELRELLLGLERAGLEPSASFGRDPSTVRVGAEVRAAIVAAVDRHPPQSGPIWLSAADAWAAPLGEPALLRLGGAAALTPEVRLALERPGVLAVAPCETAAGELTAAGVDAARVLVLAPFAEPGEDDAGGDDTASVAAFLPARDERVLDAGLAALAQAAPQARVRLTWPTPELLGRVADRAPQAEACAGAIWTSRPGAAVAGARAVLALDPWDRWGLRIRAALARGIPVVTSPELAAALDPAERERVRIADAGDSAAIAGALSEALAAGPLEPTASEPWAERVLAMIEEAESRAASLERPSPRVLITSPDLPADDESAGHLRLLEIVRGLWAIGAQADVAAAFEPWDTSRARDCADAGALAIGCRHLPFDVRDRLLRGGYDLVYAHFGELAQWTRGPLALAAPGTPLVVDSVDLHHVRMLRQATVAPAPGLFDDALRTRRRELVAYGTADAVVVATEVEREQLQRSLGPIPVHVLPTIHRSRADVPPAADRGGIVFLGGFGHPPNADAVRWLMEEIVPRLRDLGCEQPVLVAGSRMPAKVRDLVERGGGRAVGYVPRVEPLFDAARCMVAPLRFGAGIKGKIGDALASGLPVVTTPVGAEGFPDDPSIQVAESPDGLAEALAAVCGDDALWERASASGRELVERLLGPGRCESLLGELLESVAQVRVGA